MTEMINAVKAYLADADFSYNYREDMNVFEFFLAVDNGNVSIRLVPREEEDYFITYVVWEGRIPVRSLPLIYPLINEINDNTKFTTLSVDPKDGELSCHCGINTDDATFSARQVGVCVQLCVRTLDDNIERLMRAAWNAPANSDGKFN